MFFLISKISAFFLTPSNLLGMLVCVGAFLMSTRFYKVGKRLLSAGVVLLTLLGFFPFGSLLLLPLTERFPAWTNEDGDPDGVIILGGGGISPEILVGPLEVEIALHGTSAAQIKIDVIV